MRTTIKPSPVRKRTEQETFRPFIMALLKDEATLTIEASGFAKTLALEVLP